MHDMRELNEMGAISDSWMDDLEEAFKADPNFSQEQFIKQKSGIVVENQRRGLKGNGQQRPISMKAKKRMRKLQKKARKAQRV